MGLGLLDDFERRDLRNCGSNLNRGWNVGIQAAMIPRFWSRIAAMTMVVISSVFSLLATSNNKCR